MQLLESLLNAAPAASCLACLELHAQPSFPEHHVSAGAQQRFQLRTNTTSCLACLELHAQPHGQGNTYCLLGNALCIMLGRHSLPCDLLLDKASAQALWTDQHVTCMRPPDQA